MLNLFVYRIVGRIQFPVIKQHNFDYNYFEITRKLN